VDRRSAKALWAAWALALTGGVSVVVAAVLVIDADVGSACASGSACAPAFPPVARVLAFGGTAVAVIGGMVATVLAIRRLSPRSTRTPTDSSLQSAPR
jgi:Na+/phosphate symporter